MNNIIGDEPNVDKNDFNKSQERNPTVTTQRINRRNKITKQIQAISPQIQSSLPESHSTPVCDK